MAQQFVPSTGQNQSFRPQQYSDDQGQNSKSTTSGDASSYAPGYEGYDRMNPPAIQQLRGLSDGGQPSKPPATDTPAPAPAPAPAAKAPTTDNANLNPSTSGSIQSVPQGTAAGSSLKGAAGNALLSLGAKYATNKVSGMVTAAKNANANDTTITPQDNAQAYALNDNVQGTSRTGAGTPLGGNGADINDTSVSAPAEGVSVAAAPTPEPVTGTPLPAADPAWGVNARTAPPAPQQQFGGYNEDGQMIDTTGRVMANPSQITDANGVPLRIVTDDWGNQVYAQDYSAPGGGYDFSENFGYGDGGNYGDVAGSAFEGAGDYLGAAGTVLNFAQNGINGKTIGSAAGAAIGNAIVPVIGGFVGSIIGGAIGGASVICTELMNQGLLDKELYESTKWYRGKIDARTLAGYHFWAVPYVRLMKRSPLAVKFIRPWAVGRYEYIAGKFSILGWLTCVVGEPVCHLIGRITAPVLLDLPNGDQS